MTSRLALQIYDYETIGHDTLMGSVLLDAKDLLSEENRDGKWFWANVYGAPKEGGGAWKKLMNASPEMGSNF
jgi:hypothetical protein